MIPLFTDKSEGTGSVRFRHIEIRKWKPTYSPQFLVTPTHLIKPPTNSVHLQNLGHTIPHTSTSLSSSPQPGISRIDLLPLFLLQFQMFQDHLPNQRLIK